MISLCILARTLTVHADDQDYNSGAKIRFEGSIETETESDTKETGTEETGTEKPQKESSDKSGASTTGSKPSLPQTGQSSGMILQIAGIQLLLFAGWRMAVKSREKVRVP